MRCGFLVAAVGNIDPAIIDEAEDYRPKRKNHAWIWAAASAACLMLVVGAVLMLLSNHIDCGFIDSDAAAYGVVRFGGKAERYTDYAAAAEKGTVTITDELMALLDKNKEPTVKTPDGHKAEVFFVVHVYDACGASAENVYRTCLEPLGIRDEEHEGFSESGIISLTRKQILSVKSSPWLALVIEPQLVEINEKYLDTVGTDTLKVRVVLQMRNESETFMSDYGINGIDMEYGGEYGLSFIGEFDVELISQMIADPRTDMIFIDNSEKYK